MGILRPLAAMPHQLHLSHQLLPQAPVADGVGPAVRAGRIHDLDVLGISEQHWHRVLEVPAPLRHVKAGAIRLRVWGESGLSFG